MPPFDPHRPRPRLSARSWRSVMPWGHRWKGSAPSRSGHTTVRWTISSTARGPGRRSRIAGGCRVSTPTTRSRPWRSATSCSNVGGSTPSVWPSSTWAWRRPRGRTSGRIGVSAGASARCSPTWNAASSPVETGQISAGIGAAMRIAPVGALLRPNEPRGDVRGGDGGQPDDPPRHPEPGRGAGRRPRRPSPGGRRTTAIPASCSGWPPTSRGTRNGSPRSTRTSSSRSPGIGRSLSRAIAHVESLLELPRERALAALVEEANRTAPSRSASAPRWASPPPASPPASTSCMTTDSFEEALDRGHQPRRRRRHHRRDPRRLGRRPLRGRGDPRTLARSGSRTARRSTSAPRPWPDARPTGWTSPT